MAPQAPLVIVKSICAHVVFPIVLNLAEFTVKTAVPQVGEGVKLLHAVPVSPVPPLATGSVPETSVVSTTAPKAGLPAAAPCKTVVVVPWLACCAEAKMSVVQVPVPVAEIADTYWFVQLVGVMFSIADVTVLAGICAPAIVPARLVKFG